MNDPRERPPLEELDDVLRRAVEEVRADPQPEEAMMRALERARKIHSPANGRLRYFNHRLMAVSGLAAAVLVSGVFYFGWRREDQLRDAPVSIAMRTEPAREQTPTARFGAVRSADQPVTEGKQEDEGRQGGFAVGGNLNLLRDTEGKVDKDSGNKPTFSGYIVAPEQQVKPETRYEPARSQSLGRPAGSPQVPAPAPAGPDPNSPPFAPNVIGDLLPGTGSVEFKFRAKGANAQAPSPAPAAGPVGGAGAAAGMQTGGRRANAANTRAATPQTAEALPDLGVTVINGEKVSQRDLTRLQEDIKQAEQLLESVQQFQNTSERARISTESREQINEAVQHAQKRLDDARKGILPSEEELKKEVKQREYRLSLYKERKVGDEKANRVLLQKEEESLERAKKSLKEVQEAKQPQVWRRDRQRPTFARVYVGNGNSLELVSLNVTVTVEGPRARTLVDHVFRNPHDRVLEGTFEYPLPTGASASYFAMFSGQARPAAPPRFARAGAAESAPADALARLTPAEVVKQASVADGGTLQEARIVGKAKALETYEDIVRGNIDPALLEYSGGNTFTGRVFPIQPRGYNRVLITYEELLPVTTSGVQYRFPLPDCKLAELQFSVSADAAECRNSAFLPADAKRSDGGGRVSFSRSWKDQGPGGDAVFVFIPPKPEAQVISGRQGESGPLYFYTRIRPELPVETAKPFAEHAVFLLDTSLSEHPDRFDVNMKLMGKILEGDPALKRFNILTFDVAGRWAEPKGWLDNTAAERAKALSRLDGIVLEGATDFAAALDKLADVDLPERTPVDVFVLSDGQITWGESEVATVVARYENRCRQNVRFHCYRTGIGADNLELFAALTRRGGGIFNCFSEADLNGAAVGHRHQCFRLERVTLSGGPETSDVLVAGRKAAIYPGGDLIVAGRANQTGRQLLTLEGSFLGKSHTLKFPLDIDGAGELAPRAWGEVAVASLLALNDPKLDDLVTAYCQQFGIGSRVASFLVLENPNDYKRLNLETERGRSVPGGDVGRFLEETWLKMGAVESAKKSFEHFLGKIAARVPLLDGPSGAHSRRLLAALSDKDFELEGNAASGDILYENDVSAQYLAARAADRRNVDTYLQEARRRNNQKNVDGAVRVLSSVIEEYPGHTDALRLVGYRLLALNQANPAAQLFRRVLDARPFEPHSYRDVARSLEDCGKFGLAALSYEIVLAGNWHNRFRDSLKGVSQEEYINMMRQALQQRAVAGKLADAFGERLEQLASVKTQSDLRVTISWNTDATDVDLWVIEPDGTKCFYQHNRTQNGGELSHDQTQGYGPERYQVAKALPGTYTVIVHYFRANQNLLGGETHVNVLVTRHAGTPEESSQRYNVILKKANEEVEVCKVK